MGGPGEPYRREAVSASPTTSMYGADPHGIRSPGLVYIGYLGPHLPNLRTN